MKFEIYAAAGVNEYWIVDAERRTVIQVPHPLAKRAADLCYEVYKSERPAIDFYQSPGFTIEKLREFQKR